MRLNFPNASRSFDAARNRICFWGYDTTIEVSFYLQVDALQRIHKDVGITEAELLSAFDASVERIQKAATKIYGNGSKNKGRFMFTLTADDF